MNTFNSRNKRYNNFNPISSNIKFNKNKNNNTKKIRFDDDLIYICYNDADKPTKIKLYKINKKKDKGAALKYRPRNIDGYIKGLSINKKLKSILLNKDEEENNNNDNMMFSSLDNIHRIKRTKKLSDKKNVIKRNIEFIKKVEKKVKNKSMDKDRKSFENSLSKGKNKKSKENNKTKKRIKDSKNNNNTNNNTSQNTKNEYLKIEPIEEEEEGCEDSKLEKKIEAKF